LRDFAAIGFLKVDVGFGDTQRNQLVSLFEYLLGGAGHSVQRRGYANYGFDPR
jgi:hypothetical protein